jgi:hypothetical protein
VVVARNRADIGVIAATLATAAAIGNPRLAIPTISEANQHTGFDLVVVVAAICPRAGQCGGSSESPDIR